MPIHETLRTRGVPVHIFTDEIDPKARQQLIDLAESGIVVGFVSAMPDVHYGMGATVGSVFASAHAVCPNAVGVDIGCGMAALPVPGLTRGAFLAGQLGAVHRLIKERVPTGKDIHDAPKDAPILHDEARSVWLAKQLSARTARQIGTLGGGNHFIEVLHDEEDGVWVMLHSGSRHIGKVTAERYNELAKEQMAARGVRAPNADLNHLLIDSPEGQAYLTDMTWCQRYAAANRHAMLSAVAGVLEEVTGRGPDWDRAVNIHHNYCSREEFTWEEAGRSVTREVWVTRKGATSARAGQLGVIPGSMGTGSFIVRGLGNPASWHSCSHGAGRLRSRTASFGAISQADFEKAMTGIVCETAPELRDEAPQAYKDIGSVMRHQSDLVEPVRRLLPLVNVKGFEKRGDGGARGTVPRKAPARLVLGTGMDFRITGVDVSEADAKGRGSAKSVPPGEFTLRVKPGMLGESRELWVTTAEAPQRRLLVCTVTAADEAGIELTVRSVKRTMKT